MNSGSGMMLHKLMSKKGSSQQSVFSVSPQKTLLLPDDDDEVSYDLSWNPHKY